MEKIKRKDGVKYRERIYIGGQEFKSPCFEKKSDAVSWKSVKLAERRVFDSTGVLPVMRPVLQEMRFKEFAKWWLTHRVAPRSSATSTYRKSPVNMRISL